MSALNQVADLAIDLVPQWLPRSDQGANDQLVIGEREFPFFAMRPPERDLATFKGVIEAKAQTWASWLESGQPPSAARLVQEGFAIDWLEIVAPGVDWHKALRYMTALSLRTFENAAITTNIVISKGHGTIDITEHALQKLLDPLAGSPQTFVRVDGDLRLISFDAITWNRIEDAEDYKLVPEFLHPFSLVLEQNDVSIHHTSRGDLLILRRGGLRAARRKGQWRLYDPVTLKACVSDLLRSYWVGANAFEFLLDLSFRRHGALLVYDPDHRLLETGCVVNSESIIASGTQTADRCRKAFQKSVASVRMGQKNGLTGAKRLMIELASLDGAIIFDGEQILAIGAMIASHPNAGGQAGARTTAARSALAFGAYPIKVSEDGDIEVLFMAPEGTRVEKLAFL